MADKRLEIIDVFRGIAILLVVLFHFTARLPPAALNVSGTPVPPVFFGWVGVYFFYAISGYCIFLTLERSGSITSFLARRFSRIYPAFLAAAVLLFAYGLIAPLPSVPEADFHGRPSTLFDLVTNLLLVGDGRWVNGSFWSIAAEVKFYVLLAVMAAFIGDPARLGRAFSWVALLLAPVWMLAMGYADKGGSDLPEKLIGIGTIAPYLPFFAVGILARLRRTGQLRADFLLAACIVEGLAVIVLNSTDSDGGAGWLPATVAALVMLALFYLLLRFADHKGLPHIPYLSAALARIGFISFSWYLVHENLGIGFLANLNRLMPNYAAVPLTIVATLLIGFVFSEAVEWRFRKPFERFAQAILDRIAPPRFRRGPATTGLSAKAAVET